METSVVRQLIQKAILFFMFYVLGKLLQRPNQSLQTIPFAVTSAGAVGLISVAMLGVVQV
jgi:hypothetical protein